MSDIKEMSDDDLRAAAKKIHSQADGLHAELRRRQFARKKEEEEEKAADIAKRRPRPIGGEPSPEAWQDIVRAAEDIIDDAADGWKEYDNDNHLRCAISDANLEDLMHTVIEAVYGDIGDWPN